MNNLEKIKLINNRIRNGAKFFAFTYTKDGGETSERTVLINVDIAKALAKRGTPINGKGNWHKGMSENRNGYVIRNGRERYIRGIDNQSNTLKIFKLNNITNLR